MHFATPNHVRLIDSCYPPAPLASAPEFLPNAQELSRLTYYASNRPGKVTKVANALERRTRAEARKARGGNQKARASLLITLAILRSLTAECRRDLSLFSGPVVASIEAAVTALPTDLEVTARAAGVLTAWATFNDGTLIGTDEVLTKTYVVVLSHFASLSVMEQTKGDGEIRNRTRLIGLAALTAAVSSDTLYYSSIEYENQVAVIVPALVKNFFEAGVDALKLEVASMEGSNSPTSPFLTEFQPRRPIAERRAASIHVHVDGEKGPSFSDVTNASLRAFRSLLSHSNATQMGHTSRSVFRALETQKAWDNTEICCWLAEQATEWVQYQYRYVVPTRMIERLLDAKDSTPPSSLHLSLTAMITTIFTSPTPLINLSTSDTLSNLISLIIRRIAIDPNDGLLLALIQCVASLGTHVYYADQIQDLAEEISSRLVSVQVNGLLGRGRSGNEKGREEGMRCLIACLTGLIKAADADPDTRVTPSPNGTTLKLEKAPSKGRGSLEERRPNTRTIGIESEKTVHAGVIQHSRRNKITPDIWQETLAVLCEAEYGVRADYARALTHFLEDEVEKESWAVVSEPGTPMKRQKSQREPQSQPLTADESSRFLNALNAAAYTLAVSNSLGLMDNPPSTPSGTSSTILGPATNGNANLAPVQVNVTSATPVEEPAPMEFPSPNGPSTGATETTANTVTTTPTTAPATQSTAAASTTRQRPSISYAPRRSVSAALSLLDPSPNQISGAAPSPATPLDYTHLLAILTAAHESLPARAVLTSVPMLLALDIAARTEPNEEEGNANGGDGARERKRATRELVARVWAVIGRVWECQEVTDLANRALSSLDPPTVLPLLPSIPEGILHPSEKPISFEPIPTNAASESAGTFLFINPEIALPALASNRNIQHATGLDRSSLLKRLTVGWTTEIALKDSIERTSCFDILSRTEGMSPFLKIMPGLMHIDNLSFQSLARTSRTLGVGDLREALEGRASLSNPALVGPGSVFTADRISNGDGNGVNGKLSSKRSNSSRRTFMGRPGEVKDALNRLGIGKQSGSVLLKAPLTKTEPKLALLVPPYQT